MANKYHASETMVDGIRFDSKREARRFMELRLLLKAGKIKDLRLQPNLTLIEGFTTVDGERIKPEVYRADFSYIDQWGNRIYEDAKGHRTEVYRLKMKQVLDKYGVRIREV